MVRAFYQESSNTLIITPYRCGSTHLIQNVAKYDLLFLDLKKKKDLEIFEDVRKTCDKKIFMWRNPFERLVSFYYNFIFSPRSPIQYPQTLFKNSTSTKNFWKDLNNSFDKIEKNLSKDAHTITQSLYFELTDNDIESYTVLDIQDYTKWIMLTFSDKVQPPVSILDTVCNSVMMSDIVNMFDAKNKTEKLYHDDYLLQRYIKRI